MKKQESRFPWNFKTEGSLLYFGKISKRVIYYSLSDVDIKVFSDDIQSSPVIGISFDVWQNGTIRMLTICTKTTVFVISLNVNYILGPLSTFLNSLNSKMLIGYNLEKPISLFKQLYGVSFNARDLLADEEYSDSFKKFMAQSEYQDALLRGENDILAVAKFDFLIALSNQVMFAITQPAVLSFYYITTADDPNPHEAILPHQFFQHHKESQISMPFSLLPAEKLDPSSIPHIMEQNEKRSRRMMMNQNICELGKKDEREIPKVIEKKIGSKTLEITQRVKSFQGIPMQTISRTNETVKPLIIKKARTETPPPPSREKEQKVANLETRKRKESLPSNTIPPFGVKNKECFQCPICSDTKDSLLEVGSHIIIHHGCERIVVGTFQRVNCPNFVCNECNQYFSRKDAFILHIVNRHSKSLYNTLVASKILESRDEIINFIGDISNKLPEVILSEDWNKIKEFESSMRENNVIETQLKCSICNRTFNTIYELLYHSYNSHNIQ